MCGIAGFISPNPNQNSENLITIITQMTNVISHRGPDDSDHWVDAESGVALGFRRLAILDLSPTGRQPMHSADGRYVIIFNGEIYNFQSLRDELSQRGATFRGTSDTEVMLAAFSAWGVTEAVKRLNGMFAFALWDRQERTLHLVRDRLGIKPLYYGWMGDTFLFGSEIKALRAHPAFDSDINRDALTSYLRLGYVPSPLSIYTRASKLPPACILTIKPGQGLKDTAPQPYWSVRDAVERGLANPFDGGESEAIEALEAHLKRSVGLRMVADVPLGAFLSGGVDSSAIVALMQSQSNRPVKTFTIGFYASGFDEAKYAKAVARHLGTEHTELYVTPEETRAVVPLLPTLYDEPFSDPSQIPTYLVSQMARKYVTVSLSGDGGDEVFGGYNRHFLVPRLWKNIRWLPRMLRKGFAGVIRGVPPGAWLQGMRAIASVYKPARDLPNPADKLYRLADTINAPGPEAIYYDLVSYWKNPARLVLGGKEPLIHLFDKAHWAQTGTFNEQMMYLDTVTYLPDDILAKVDRASMGVSLEARAPFLDDHETVEFAWRLPLQMKVRDHQGKWILRKVLQRYVPEEMVERPKMGFGVPIESWLREDLRDWAESLLDETRLRQEGYFDPQPIREVWREHLSGERNWQYPLWTVLMFQAWLEEYKV